MPVLDTSDALELLTHGTLDIEGRLVDASNTTLRAVIEWQGTTARCVYKPVRGERPLWDFPDGTLAGREVSAYLVGAATGWDPVPPTVLRGGPYGPGMCQLWIDDDVDNDDVDPVVGFAPATAVPDGWLHVASARDEDGAPYVLAHADDPRLARLAAYDVVVNNADRKGGHILTPATGHIYGVDHGVTFHLDNKLRTVLWGFIDRPLADDVRDVLRKVRADLDGTLGEELAEHLMGKEIAETAARLDRLLAADCYPPPSGDWPAVPWPPI